MNTNGIARPKDAANRAREIGREQAYTIYSPEPAHPGFTKLQELAARAMQGIVIASGENAPDPGTVAREAFDIAEAWLLEAAKRS